MAREDKGRGTPTKHLWPKPHGEPAPREEEELGSAATARTEGEWAKTVEWSSREESLNTQKGF